MIGSLEGNSAAASLNKEQLHSISKRAVALPLLPNSNAISQQQAPRLIQWAKEAVQYFEGSTLVLSCSLANNGASGLRFAWFRQGKQLQAAAKGQDSTRLSIESLPDYSFLRLTDLRSTDSGQYTCLVSNSLNQEDRTSTQVMVNGELCQNSAE